ncbi:MAG: carotenoid 1,2-hydratase [Rhodothermales bacterium]|nr:carotenoid 1,2-hydratase [Rhodothermales bacterium]
MNRFTTNFPSRSQVLTGLVVIVLTVFAGCDPPPLDDTLQVSAAMGGDTTGYARADKILELQFPEDYGPHPDFKTEWWYYTGNVWTDSGDRFGYEFTIFRSALKPTSPQDTTLSDWATNQLYMAHFGLTDKARGDFYHFERFSRGAAGLAGAVANPYRVWLDDWEIHATGSELYPTRLYAHDGPTGIDITLQRGKPIVLQGDQGLDQKGAGSGNASYYYSFTRLPTTGSVTVGDEVFSVEGLSWKDHEWSTSALGPKETGWDWFALQLSDGRDVMFYQLRENSGNASEFSNGMLVEDDGTYRRIETDDVVIEVLDYWTSPHSNVTYPSRWTLTYPTENLTLTVTPIVNDQEMNVSVRYWEGAVDILGSSNGQDVTGQGYVELAGYVRDNP